MTPPGDIPHPVEWPSGWSVRHVAETGSTNDDLLAAAAAGTIGDRSVLVTAHQTAGKGRLSRRWDAPPGSNLLASIHVVELPANPITHRVGLAIVHAIDAQTGGAANVGLKWPNDVLLDGRKLAGVLAQRSTSAPGAVVGFGVNLGWAPEGAARLADVPAIAVSDPPLSVDRLLAAVLRAFDALPARIDDQYRQRLLTVGRRVRVELPGERFRTGRAVGVDDDGRLLVVDDDGDEHCFDVGDVVHLRDG